MDDTSRVVGMGLTNPFMFEEPSRLDNIMCGGPGWGFDFVSEEMSNSTIISSGCSNTMKVIVERI